ncbi:signal recognition particle-docking protein FtsY [Candidatus Nitrosopumilus koreensis AR1]|uniref:Signal recognition particle-docking protein FtsY n=1 Tax=Candidatus Nitrosopumilus koreensis AR1 TaxID=1229908 RepID=K0B735_9ARCH|nr:hypothetical protein [Candidatus Nitrosopumilus koreensis]AFS80296.1 signal recognition particle-docking protein FtsY [Candidatus Nitrosopumilus koreensis AR1]
MFDIPPPENDDEAFKLGNKIRQWIKDGKPKPGESKEEESEDDDEDDDEEDIHKHDKEEPKKKKGRFGFFRR